MKNLLYVYKCMGIIVQNEWRHRTIFATLIIALAGLFISRILLNLGLFLFLLASMLHSNLGEQLRIFFKNIFLLTISLLFFIPLVSGLWSSDQQEWIRVLQVKLPLLLLPVAFAGNWQLSQKQWKYISYCLLVFVAIGCCWSFLAYFRDMDVINTNYLKAKTLPAPLGNDHVRFSWLVSLAVAIGTHLLVTGKNWLEKGILSFLLLFFVIYLHVLSARMGLLLLYFFMTGFFINLVVKKNWRFVWVLPLFILITIFAWFSFPTLQNRIRYNRYDLSFIQQNKYLPGGSDGNRLLSIRASWKVWMEHPLGVGAGDIKTEMNKWYDQEVPGMLETDKLYPSSEWLVYANTAGWPGFILFTLIMVIPLFMKNMNYRFFWIMLNSMMAISFLVETSLETQFGIFIYSFILLYCWKWWKSEKEITLAHD